MAAAASFAEDSLPSPLERFRPPLDTPGELATGEMVSRSVRAASGVPARARPGSHRQGQTEAPLQHLLEALRSQRCLQGVRWGAESLSISRISPRPEDRLCCRRQGRQCHGLTMTGFDSGANTKLPTVSPLAWLGLKRWLGRRALSQNACHDRRSAKPASSNAVTTCAASHRRAVRPPVCPWGAAKEVPSQEGVRAWIIGRASAHAQ